MPVQTKYTVVGMTCGHCVQAVTEELTKVPGVRDVRVELEAGQVTVDSDAPLPIDAVVHAVDEAGYELAGAES
ncbi:heavy metal-associated domain-containing protein [Luedemannella helvata]|uniref:Heavy-metal-associated domain-containing protein n=1 Tax=Luedemannella helvata TaxID=349315 RepID=A0ABN2JQQ9_9ACTN